MHRSHKNAAAANRKAIVKRSKVHGIGITDTKRTTTKGDIFHYKMINGEKTLVKVTARGKEYEPLDYFKMKLGC